MTAGTNAALLGIKGAFVVFAVLLILRIQAKILKIIFTIAVILVIALVLVHDGVIPIGI